MLCADRGGYGAPAPGRENDLVTGEPGAVFGRVPPCWLDIGYGGDMGEGGAGAVYTFCAGRCVFDSGTLGCVAGRLNESLDDVSSSISLAWFAYGALPSCRAVAPRASSSVVKADCDLMKLPRSSRIGWYLVSGFFEAIA